MRPLLYIAGLLSCSISASAFIFPWKRQLTASQECGGSNNSVGICTPTTDDIWYNGSLYEFTWNYNNPGYLQRDTINLHILYIEGQNYTSVKEWKVSRMAGSFVQQVDDTWFPSQLPDDSANKTWNPSVYLIPDHFSIQFQIDTNYYDFPAPVTFTLIQSSHNTTATGDGNGSNNTSSSGTSGLAGWLIAVIVIASVVFVLAILALIWFIRRLKRGKASGAAESDHRNLFQTAGGGEMASVPTIAAARPFAAGSIHNSNDISSIHSSTPMIQRTNMSSPTSPPASPPLPSQPTVAQHIMQHQDARQSSSILSSTDAIMIADTFRQFMRKPEWNEHHDEDEEEEAFKQWNEPPKRKPLGDDLFRKADDDNSNEQQRASEKEDPSPHEQRSKDPH